jgi:hypothetical protein
MLYYIMWRYMCKIYDDVELVNSQFDPEKNQMLMETYGN